MTMPVPKGAGFLRFLGTLIVNKIVFVRRSCLGAVASRVFTCRNAIAARASSVAVDATESLRSNPSALSV
ncbi:hypothetical protein LMG18101_04376 [Ralstonia flaminis]|jgi:hypothetical protein|uniref:Secreted protein n=1 Tax=Ralstonia flaminis TaxID=3058597 RepID=A0ABN9JUJ5_9RALS|nr:hypothetical protein LMG18101_04376 [Ralstonia sp. LMG 18101]